MRSGLRGGLGIGFRNCSRGAFWLLRSGAAKRTRGKGAPWRGKMVLQPRSYGSSRASRPKYAENGSGGHYARPVHGVSKIIGINMEIRNWQESNRKRQTNRGEENLPNSRSNRVVLLGKRRQFESSHRGRKMFPSRPPVSSQHPQHQLPSRFQHDFSLRQTYSWN